MYRPARGFTLIELLIAVTIIIAISASIFPAFSRYITGQNVKRAQEQIKSDLRSIQNKAQTGALSDTLIGSNPVMYWGIRFQGGSGNYEYFISHTNSGCINGAIPANQLQGSATLGDDLVVKNTPANYKCIYFSIDEGDLANTNINSPIIVGYSTSNANCRRINFNSQGLIYNDNSGSCT